MTYLGGAAAGKLYDMKEGSKAKSFTKNVRHPYDNQPARKIEWIVKQAGLYENYHAPNINRFLRNARMYWHLDFGQWPANVVEKLRQQGRRPPTFPVIPDKIETLIGSYLSNSYDIKMEADDGSLDQLTQKVMGMYMSDKNKMDWECSNILTLLDSMIGVGYERFYISDMVDDFGNIAMESLNPRYVLPSPAWKSEYTRDLDDYFTWSMMTATEIIDKYGKHGERLMELYRRERMEGIDYGYNFGAVPRYRDADEKWGSAHKVWEFNYVEKIDRWYEYDKKNNNFFPNTGFKNGSNEDREVKMHYIEIMGLSPDDDICWRKQKEKVKKISACAPTLDAELMLKSGKDLIQTGGVNLYPLGIKYRGQYMGLIVDRLYDIQTGINKGEMNIQDIQMRTAKGAFFIDRGMFGDSSTIEDEVRKNWNDPAARLILDEGSTARYPNGIQQVPSSPPTSDMFNNTDRYYDHADRFSKVSAAQDSRTESSKESGRLFQMKFEAGQLQQIYPKKFWERHIKEIAEGWIQQAKLTYSGVKRTFSDPETKSTFDVNTPGVNKLTGEKVIINDIATLPRMKVTLSPSQKGLNLRLSKREQMGQLMETVQPDPTLGLLKIIFTAEALKTMEFSDELKMEVDYAAVLLKKREALRVELESQQMETQLMQMNSQKQQVQQQLGVPQEAPQEEAIPENVSERVPDEEEIMDGTVLEQP